MQDMVKVERCVLLASWLMEGERVSIAEAAARMAEPYRNLHRDIESISRIMPIAKDEGGRFYLIRVTAEEEPDPMP